MKPHTAAVVAWTVAGVVVVLDQATKVWAVARLEGSLDRPLVGEFLQLSFVRNPGAAFGLGGGATIVFSVIAATVAVVLVRMTARLTSVWWGLAMGLMLGGALGNLTDRVFREPGRLQGHVVDFLRLPNWPVFNVADMAVVSSAVLMIILSLLNVPWGDTSESDQQAGVAGA